MIWWAAAAFFAFMVKGLCGFADGLIFGTFMSFADNNVIITPVQTLLCFPSNIIMAWKNRKGIRLSFCVPVIAVMIAGDLLGGAMLSRLDTHLLKVLLGFIVAGLGVEMLLRERIAKKRKASVLMMALIGILSGIVSGLFSVGALMTAYFSRVAENTEAFKGNICMVFAWEAFFRIAMYVFAGVLNAQILQRALLLLPVMVAGLYTGMLFSGRLSEKMVKRIVVVVLILSGLTLAVMNW